MNAPTDISLTSDQTLEHLQISDLSPHPDNPRTHSRAQIKQIAESIKSFGFRIPVLVDGDNRIICGHGRVAACGLLGIESVPALRVDDLSDAQIRALMIADNRLTELSDWDSDLLAQNFQILVDTDLDFDLDVVGFDYGDIEQLLVDHEPDQPNADDQLPDIEDVPLVCQLGDLWLCGEHRLICGDSTEASTYEALFEKKKAAVVFTDPPYNLPAKDIGRVCAEQHGDFACAAGEMSPEEFTAFLGSVFEQLCRWSVSGSIHYVCMDWRHAGELLTAGNANYRELKNLCVWAKDRAGMGTFYRSQHELVFVFKHGKVKHQNHFKLGQHGRMRSNVWQYPSVLGMGNADGEVGSDGALAMHPTIKPVAMIEEALRDCSKRGEIVLDAFLGSGSTLIAAERTNRICHGIEIAPRYLDVAIRRWESLTGLEAIHAESGKTFDELGQQRQEQSDD